MKFQGLFLFEEWIPEENPANEAVILIMHCFRVMILWLKTRRMCFWLTAILLLSFLLKYLYWHLDPIVSRDGCLYIRLAQAWYDSGDFKEVLNASEIRIPPLLLFLMKSLMRFGLSAEAAGVWLNLVLGTFTPLLTYGIAYEVTQRKDVSICSALLIAVNPTMNKLAVAVQRDMLYLFFIGLGLWFLAAGIRRRQWHYWLGVGIADGFAMLTRYETLEMLVIVPVILIIMSAGKYLVWKKCLHYTGLFCIGFAGTIFCLAFLMGVQNDLFSNYSDFYLENWDAMEEPIN